MSMMHRRVGDAALQLGLAKILCVDSFSTPPNALLKQVQSLKKDLEQAKRLADFRYLLEEGGLKDCTIQVIIGPPGGVKSPEAKRAKTKEGGGIASSSVYTATTTTKDVRAHSVILSSRSEYFKAALVRGQWAESQDKTIDIDLPCEEAFNAFKLLVDLSYEPCYKLEDDDERFSPDKLLQLIMVANMFEFIGSIEPCCEAMKKVVDADNALAIIESLCRLDTAHDAIQELIDVAVGLLKPFTWEPGTFAISEVEALASAKCHGLQAITSVDVLISIIRSNRLVIDSENTTFTLVRWWIEGQDGWTKEQKEEAFKKVHDSRALRYHRMDPLYLASYAIRNPWVESSGHGLSILQQALLETSRDRISSHKSDLRKSRATGMKSYTMTIQVDRRQLTSGTTDVPCFLGMVQGYPILAYIQRKEKEGDNADTFGLFIGWYGGSELNQAYRARRPPAVKVRVDVKLTPDYQRKGRFVLLYSSTLEENYYFGSVDLFHAPWEEVVSQGSPYFTTAGLMKMDFTLTVMNT